MRLLHDMFVCVQLLSSCAIAYLIKNLENGPKKDKILLTPHSHHMNDLSTFFNSAKQM